MRLLHLARVPGAADQDQLLAEVDDDEGAGAGAVPRGIGLELGRVQHGEAGTELRQLRRHGPDEHVAHEERVPRVRRDEPHRNPVGRVGAAEEVLDEDLVGIEVAPHVLVQPLEGRRLQPRVLLPPDPVGAARLLDDELVLGRATGVGGGDGAEGAAIGQHALAPGDGVLDQRGGSEIGVDPDGKQAVLYQGEALTRGCGRLGHNSHAPGGAEEGLEDRHGRPPRGERERSAAAAGQRPACPAARPQRR